MPRKRKEVTRVRQELRREQRREMMNREASLRKEVAERIDEVQRNTGHVILVQHLFMMAELAALVDLLAARGVIDRVEWRIASSEKVLQLLRDQYGVPEEATA